MKILKKTKKKLQNLKKNFDFIFLFAKDCITIHVMRFFFKQTQLTHFITNKMFNTWKNTIKESATRLKNGRNS
jgi:hypothetical protein